MDVLVAEVGTKLEVGAFVADMKAGGMHAVVLFQSGATGSAQRGWFRPAGVAGCLLLRDAALGCGRFWAGVQSLWMVSGCVEGRLLVCSKTVQRWLCGF